MKIRIRIPLSWRRTQQWSPHTDQLEPLRRFFFLNVSHDPNMFFAHWGVALTLRFGIGYA
jgi:hypothetical protein